MPAPPASGQQGDAKEQEAFAGVSDLKAHFEQLARAPTPSPNVAPKPSQLRKPPAFSPPSPKPLPVSRGGVKEEDAGEEESVTTLAAPTPSPPAVSGRTFALPPPVGAAPGEGEGNLTPSTERIRGSSGSSGSSGGRRTPPPRPRSIASESVDSPTIAPVSRATSPAPPALPLATRPTLSTPASKKPPPPPVPASRKAAVATPPALAPPIPDYPSSSLSPSHTGASSPANGSETISGVKLLASRFGAASASAPISRAATPSPAPTPLSLSPLSSPIVAAVETLSPTGSPTLDVDDPLDSASKSEELKAGSSSSTDSAKSPPIPPRPPRTADSAPPSTSMTSRSVPPPIPTRLQTATLSVSPPTPIQSASLPLPPPPRASSASRHPPPSRAVVKPTAVAVLGRPGPSLSAPPSPAPTLSASDGYTPPPPPARAIPANTRIEPVRPTLPVTAAGDESSDDEGGDDDSTFTKSQEYPDATFANRRPPFLRNRKSIQAQTYFSSFAIRGTKVVHAGQHHAYIWYPSHHSGVAESVGLPGAEQKVQCMEFSAAHLDRPEEDGRYVWGGTREGNLFQLDVKELRISDQRHGSHGTHSIDAIYRLGRSMLSLDESGKLLIWGTFDSPEAPDLSSTPKIQRVGDKLNFHALLGNELWTSSGPGSSTKGSAVGAPRSPQIKVYNATCPTTSAFVVTPRAITTPESAGSVGSVTAAALVPSSPHVAYLAHDNGYVSVWDRTSYTCLSVQRVSPYGITSMVGVGRCLWAGFRNGYINVYDVVADPWTVVKAWKAHKGAVIRIAVDPASLWLDETLQIASSGTDMAIHLWDAFLRDDWLDSELHLRQREFCTFRKLRVLCISWNVDAAKPNDLTGAVQNYEFLQQCLTSVEGPDIISFGFQEMIDLESKKLTAKTMLLGKKKGDQKFADGVSSSYRLWHDKLINAVRLSMPPESPYTVVHVGDMVGLFSCIFIKNAERAGLRDVALTTVKTGMGGRYGNKGAIIARFVVDDSSICFINVHLAAGQSHRRQRDHDLANILEEKSGFSELATSSPGAYSAGGGGTMVFDHELCILSGDLNYRIDLRRDVVVKAVEDNLLSSLLPHDQLLKNLATNQSFRLRSFREAPIDFAPTYKYDPGTDFYDSSPKKRIPAWCDRVLWRADRADKVTPVSYRRYECNVSDHRPISAAFDMEIKSIVPDKRAVVWKEVESAWFGVESDRLQSARDYYTGM